MTHNIPLISTLAIALGLALLFGVLAARLKLPTLVGYLLAGVLIGPHTPGFVANGPIARELAEIGIMLLMFGVGLHFSLNDLMTVRKIALPGALLQIIVATALGTWVATAWGWGMGGSLVFGLALSVASTVVLLRALEINNVLNSTGGRIAVGWLVVEDLAMVLVIVLLPPLAAWLQGNSSGVTANLAETLGITLVKVSAFIILMVMIGRKVFPRLLWQISRTGSRELFTLSVITIAITIAYLASELFGVSFALGAFFAGMMMRESSLSHRAAEESLPFREAFAVLFFVSVGMLFDPMVLINHPGQVLAVIGIIIFGKTIAAAALVLFFRYPLNTALLVSASLAQIGEFSFILANLGMSLGLLPSEGQSLILAGALLSIAINPLLFTAIKPIQRWISSHQTLSKILDRTIDPLTTLPATTHKEYLSGQVVLIGYGRVGRRIGENLFKYNIPYVVIEKNREIVESLRAEGIAAIYGDAAELSTLPRAQIGEAGMLVIAIPDTFSMHQMIESARKTNPHISILARVHDEEEGNLLLQEGIEKVFNGEFELAKNLGAYVLHRYGVELRKTER